MASVWVVGLGTHRCTCPPPWRATSRERRREQADADLGVATAVIGPDHHLDTPGVVAAAQLCVADQRPVGRLPCHETGEALAASVDQVEPLVLAKRVVAVCDHGVLEELRHLGDVGLAHPAFDLDGVHGRRLPGALEGLVGRGTVRSAGEPMSSAVRSVL